MRAISALAAFGFAAIPAIASAESWKPSHGSFARYGLISEVCTNDGHAPTCLALTCRAGRLELVSAAGGGGPIEGPAILRFSGRSARVSFVYDVRAIDILGVAAARARIPSRLFEGLNNTRVIELSTRDSGARIVHRFTMNGFANEVRRATGICTHKAAASQRQLSVIPSLIGAASPERLLRRILVVS